MTKQGGVQVWAWRVCLLVEGRGSRVTSRGSRVNGRGSKIYSKLFSNYFLTSSTQKFTGSCLLEFPGPVFAAFGSYFCLSKTFTFPRTLRRAEHQNLALSIFTVKLFFSGPRSEVVRTTIAVTWNTVKKFQICHYRHIKRWSLLSKPRKFHVKEQNREANK